MGPVLVNASCVFHKPILYPEDLVVSLFVGPPGRSSYDCYYEIHAKSDNRILYAEGITKVVWIDRSTGKSVQLPEYLRRHLPMPI